jgi:septal ring factor EnvC (AmiA/AmiB activator)
MIMSKIIPHETYDGVVKQLHAASSLITSKDKQIALLKADLDNLKQLISTLDKEAIDSERNTNAILTERVLFLENCLRGVIEHVRNPNIYL